MSTELDKAREALEAADKYTTARPPGAMSGVVERHHLRAALTEVDRLTAALAEAEATIANERGEGEPPEPGWAWAEGAWDHERGTVVGRDEDDRWCFAASDGVYLYPEPNTARAAMRAATSAAKEQG